MATREMIEQVVLESGLWDKGRKSTHGFVLSPSVYEMNRDQSNELKKLGFALQQCLRGLGEIVAVAQNPQSRHGKHWDMIARALRTGVPKSYHDIQALNPRKVPSILKVDLMEAEDGRYYIAEIDGHNKHGLGYSTLAARIRDVVCPDAKSKSFPGVAALIAKEVRQHSSGMDDNDLILLYADQERFYYPEFCILRDELAGYGVNLIINVESKVKIKNGCPVVGALTEKSKTPELFVDFPFLYHNPELNNYLVRLYQIGEIDFLIPPKPFLGSKAILALLRNDAKDEELEVILLYHISRKSLETVRSFIPETYLVAKKSRSEAASKEYWEKFMAERSFVLKECISSGMKGIVFSDDPRFDYAFGKALNSYYQYVLQREVVNKARVFHYFTEDGEIREAEWYVRVTVHYSSAQIADVIVTARQDKKVHGALDALQLGVVII